MILVYLRERNLGSELPQCLRAQLYVVPDSGLLISAVSVSVSYMSLMQHFNISEMYTRHKNVTDRGSSGSLGHVNQLVRLPVSKSWDEWCIRVSWSLFGL
jgi:hypothetical protein